MTHQLDSHKIRIAARTRRGSMTFKEAAEESGITINALFRIENDGRPGTDILIRLCEWCDMPLDYFVSSPPKNG